MTVNGMAPDANGNVVVDPPDLTELEERVDGIGDAVSEENRRAVGAEEELGGSIAAEASRAKAAEQGLRDDVSSAQTAIADRYTKRETDEKIAAATPSDYDSVKGRVAAVEAKVPAQATAQNQLADKAFVNSSIATNTAFYISDGGRPFQSLADLENYEGALTNNDYAFVVGLDAAGNTTYTRYKWNDATETWGEEYVLNNSSFTAEQWAAISSGITSGLVAKLGALPTEEALAAALAEKASTADATLTPVYSQTPTFSEWTGTVLAAENIEVTGLPYFQPQDDEHPESYGWYLPTSQQDLFLGVYDIGATSLSINDSIDGWYLNYTATRTRTDIIGYTLGSQTDKPLQPKGDYALLSDLATKLNKSGGTMTGGLAVPNLTVGSRQDGSTVGADSVAEGFNVTASGRESHAEGFLSVARGSNSHAEGRNTVAQNDAEHAQGFFNISHKASVSTGNAGNTLSSIGFGEIVSPKNAVETMQDGKTFIYGLGGYNGTNPTGAGVQDLASVINSKASTSDIYAAIQQIAPAFTSKAYAVNELCTYNGVVYRCKSGYTATASSPKPDSDTTHWEAKKVSELFLPLTGDTMTGPLTAPRFDVPNGDVGGLRLNYADFNATIHYNGAIGVYIGVKQGSSGTYYINFPDKGGTVAFTAGTGHTGNLAALDANGNPTDSGIKADDLARYAHVTKTLDNGAAVLDDRAINAVGLQSGVTSATLTLPAAVPGRVRDFIVRLTLMDAATVSFTAVDNITWDSSGDPSGTFQAGTHLLSFTEVAPGVFRWGKPQADLTGQTFDFSTTQGVMDALAAVVAALGGSISNKPSAT